MKGQGHYVGTYMAWGVNNNGWWGEGEIKFYLDGDKEFPTICGTGTEDYFCGSYNFENQETHQYQEFTTPYAGLPQVIRPDGVYQSQTRFGLYRWHITDPGALQQDMRVTIQALGWRSGRRYLPLQDDIASVAFWYQTLPDRALPGVAGQGQARDHLTRKRPCRRRIRQCAAVSSAWTAFPNAAIRAPAFDSGSAVNTHTM